MRAQDACLLLLLKWQMAIGAWCRTLQSGCPDIVIAREDGAVEVWDVDMFGQPKRKFATQVRGGQVWLVSGAAPPNP